MSALELNERQQEQVRQAEDLLFTGPQRRSVAKEFTGGGSRPI